MAKFAPGIQKDLSDNLFLRYGKSLVLLDFIANRQISFFLAELLFAKILINTREIAIFQQLI